jgi:TRAP-type mannitol/chloroaromatic compound transport system substrate-binding protein
MRLTMRFLRLVVAGVVATLVLGQAAAAQKIGWRLTTYVPEGNQDYREYIELYVKLVDTLTSGEIKIQPFGAGVLAPAFEAPQAVQKGIADMAINFPAFLVNQDPANAFLAGLPGGMSAEATMAWLFNGGGEKLWADFRRETMGLHAVVSGIGPSEIFAHSHKPIRTAEDLKGLKFRTAGAWAAILKDYFGASPTVLPASEIFTALERRVIDGTEYITPSLNYATGLHNVARYVVLPGVHQPTYVYDALWKKEVWDALRADLKEKLIAAGRLTLLQGHLKVSAADMDAMEKLRAGKNEFITLDPAFVSAIRKAGRDWATKTAAEQTAKGNPWMERFAASYFAFQDKWIANSDIRVPDVK